MEKVRKSPKEKKVRKPKWTKNDSELTALALPTTVWYVLFCFLPMFGLVIAFKNYKYWTRHWRLFLPDARTFFYWPSFRG